MTPLEQMIALHRALLADELTFSPSQSRPPVAFTWDDRERALVPDDRPLVINPLSSKEVVIPDSATQSTAIGVPMSARMLRYLTGPSPDTPWSAALKALRLWCRREHEFHRAADRPYWRGSLCHQLVVLTVIGKPRGTGPATLPEAAQILQCNGAESTLRDAFAYIEQHIDRSRARAERRAKEDEGHGPGAVPRAVYEERHDQPGLHKVDCPKCRRNAA